MQMAAMIVFESTLSFLGMGIQPPTPSWGGIMLEGKEFIGGDKIGLADVLLFCFLAFGNNVGQPLNPDNKNVAAWFERMQARPSASA